MPSYELSMRNFASSYGSRTATPPGRPVVHGPENLALVIRGCKSLFGSFRLDPTQMWRLQTRRGDPQFADLSWASRRRRELLQLLDSLNPWIAEQDRAVMQEMQC